MIARKYSRTGSGDFAALLAGAEAFDPRTPARRIQLPAGERSFAFTLDNDLVKLVTLTPGYGSLDIVVRYADDAILDEEHHIIALSGDPTIVGDAFGVVVGWRAPLISWLSWPEISRTRRF
jgi:hypothetical protein